MDTETPFDRGLRRRRRDRAAASKSGNPLARLIGDELLDRLEFVNRSFTEALVLGCPDRHLPERLEERGIGVVAADAGFRFAHASGGIQCDEDRLPFAHGSFDLIISPGSLDGVNDLPGALTLIRRALRPDGLFLAGLIGAGSLPRLRGAMLAADAATGAAPHIHPQIDVRAAGDLLARAGFALPVAESHSYRIRYSDMMALVRDLRASGSTNLLTRRPRHALTRAALSRALADFTAHSDPDGKTTERLEILYLTAWAPSPEQPAPARRGSATRSLASVLRPPRHP